MSIERMPVKKKQVTITSKNVPSNTDPQAKVNESSRYREIEPQIVNVNDTMLITM